MRTVLIAIQARSDSKRLPAKAHLPIGGKPLLQWVIDSCNQAVRYLTQGAKGIDAHLHVAVLTPHGDSIVSIYGNQVEVIEGDHDDVLSRFVQAAEAKDADYVVRITADCLRIPAHLIAKHVRTALSKDRDYVTNVHYRTFKEGWDCEVLSRRLLQWLNVNAVKPHDREHVTTFIAPDCAFPFQDRDGKPNICHVLNTEDESELKTSIDTKEEYETAKKSFEHFIQTKNEARKAGIFIL